MAPGWVPRRLGVLHAVGLPDHLAAAQRVARARATSTSAASGPGGPGGSSPRWPSSCSACSLAARRYATPGQLEHLRGDTLATLAYVANWRYLLTGVDYGGMTFNPSPLLHTWSLAIEEQFYLLFPLVAVVALRHPPPAAPSASPSLGLLARLARPAAARRPRADAGVLRHGHPRRRAAHRRARRARLPQRRPGDAGGRLPLAGPRRRSSASPGPGTPRARRARSLGHGGLASHAVGCPRSSWSR